MNEEKQRIAIAEACGWTDLYRATRKGVRDPKGVCIFGHGPNDSSKGGWKEFSQIPDYLHDLNAMHEAEKVLPKDQQWNYANWLHSGNEGNHLANDWFVAHATAAQRAEAFLRTIGKWEDS